MDILVFIKEVLDSSVPLEIREAERVVVQREPEPISVLSPADRAAVEQAVRLRDRAGGGFVIVATVGPEQADWSLRLALARGADRAIHVCDPAANGSDALATALILSRVAQTVPFDLILCGNSSLDTGTAAVPAMLAELLALPQVTSVVGLEVEAGIGVGTSATLTGARPAAVGPRTVETRPAATHPIPATGVGAQAAVPGSPPAVGALPAASGPFPRLRAVRRLERGNRQVVGCSLPAVVGVDASIAEPRYVSVRALLAAQRQAVERQTLADLGIAAEQVGAGAAGIAVARLAAPRPRPKKVWTPDATMSAADRLKFLMGGGTQKKSSSTFLEGTAEVVAGHIVEYLKKEKLI